MAAHRGQADDAGSGRGSSSDSTFSNSNPSDTNPSDLKPSGSHSSVSKPSGSNSSASKQDSTDQQRIEREAGSVAASVTGGDPTAVADAESVTAGENAADQAADKPGTSPDSSSVRGDSDFHKLWWANSISMFGSAFANGAVMLVAILLVNAADWQVAMMMAISALVAGVFGLPLGRWVEYRRKRPVLIGADLVQFAAWASIPIIGLLTDVTLTQLIVVASIAAVATVAFQSAAGAHTVALVGRQRMADASGRLESATWITRGIGPPLGGAAISLIGPLATVAVDAVSYLASLLFIPRIRRPEPPPPKPAAERPSLWTESVAGFQHIWRHPQLRSLLLNTMLFGGAITMLAPLLTLMMLRDVGLAPWQYGLEAGVACLGPLAGSMLAKRALERFGIIEVLVWFGIARIVTLVLLPLSPHGWAGFAWIAMCEGIAMFFFALTNPAMATYRAQQTPDHLLARVAAAWAVALRVTFPLFIAAGSLLTVVMSPRHALWVTAGVLVLSVIFLPYSGLTSRQSPDAAADRAESTDPARSP